MYIAAMLSHFKGIGVISVMSNSANNQLNHVNSEHTRRMERYSASADESETVACFLDFQEIGLPPIVMKYPLTDRRVVGHAAQSESQKASSLKSDVLLSKIP